MLGGMCNPDPAIRRKAPDHLVDIYNTDVRPLLAGIREAMGLAPDPLDAYRRSGYAKGIASERVAGAQVGWGA